MPGLIPSPLQVELPQWLSRPGRAPARALRLAWAALQRFLQAGGMRQGAAVAFYAAFSIAPLLVVVTGVMVWLLGNDTAQTALIDALTRLVGHREAHTLSQLLARGSTIVEGRPAALGTWLALGTMLVGATAVFVELRAALQAMMGEVDRAFSFWDLLRVRLLAIGIALGCGFLLSVAMFAQAASLLALRWLGTQLSAAPLLSAAENLWSWAVITLLFALLIRGLPSGRLRMRDALVGASVAAALFMVGRYGISLYIAHTATRSVLGAAGSFAALLVWVYWSSQIFLLGAALAIELAAQAGSPAARRAPLNPS